VVRRRELWRNRGLRRGSQIRRIKEEGDMGPRILGIEMGEKTLMLTNCKSVAVDVLYS